jgi:hypothetical protein
MNAPFRSRRPPLRGIDGRLEALAAAYRLRAANGNATPHDRGFEASVGLAWAALVIGLIPVTAALASGSIWGAEPTLGLMISALGAMGLGLHYTRAWRATLRLARSGPISVPREQEASRGVAMDACSSGSRRRSLP